MKLYTKSLECEQNLTDVDDYGLFKKRRRVAELLEVRYFLQNHCIALVLTNGQLQYQSKLILGSIFFAPN
jgi:hypothetical protein